MARESSASSGPYPATLPGASERPSQLANGIVRFTAPEAKNAPGLSAVPRLAEVPGPPDRPGVAGLPRPPNALGLAGGQKPRDVPAGESPARPAKSRGEPSKDVPEAVPGPAGISEPTEFPV